VQTVEKFCFDKKPMAGSRAEKIGTVFHRLLNYISLSIDVTYVEDVSCGSER
jgi:hypothetical protein